MNIITNNCLYGFYYKQKGFQYQNPFVWNLINSKDFERLIRYYDELNFEDVEIKVNKDIHDGYGSPMCDLYSCSIYLKHNIRIQFNHYKYDPKCLTPKALIPDVFYYRNFEYCWNKWHERAKRISEEPIFVYHWGDIDFNTFEDIVNIINTAKEKNKRLIIITANEKLLPYESNNIKIHVTKNNFKPVQTLTNELEEQLNYFKVS